MPTQPLAKGHVTMDFHEAVHVHISWLQNLLSDIKTPQKLSHEEIAQDNVCNLGKWIYGANAQVRELPEYIELKQVHADMHQAVSNAVVLAQEGKLRESQQYLSIAGDCIDASKHLLDCCDKLFKKIDEINHE